MVCGLYGAKQLPEPMLACCQLDSSEQILLKLHSEFYHFDNLFVSSVRMAAILSRGRRVKHEDNSDTDSYHIYISVFIGVNHQ